ncbi:MAG: succinate dehydrogenase, hydrophobic membrane anchor protein [Candidatus Eisenbacteria bacterium]
MTRDLMARARPSTNFELASWLFMRVSGVLIAFLLLGHILVMHILHHVDEVNYQFAAERLANPFWRIYDLVLLGLVLMHGLTGVRIALDDYVHNRGWRIILKTALWLVGALFLIVGAFVLFTFQPAGV